MEEELLLCHRGHEGKNWVKGKTNAGFNDADLWQNKTAITSIFFLLLEVNMETKLSRTAQKITVHS